MHCSVYGNYAVRGPITAGIIDDYFPGPTLTLYVYQTQSNFTPILLLPSSEVYDSSVSGNNAVTGSFSTSSPLVSLSVILPSLQCLVLVHLTVCSGMYNDMQFTSPSTTNFPMGFRQVFENCALLKSEGIHYSPSYLWTETLLELMLGIGSPQCQIQSPQ